MRNFSKGLYRARSPISRSHQFGDFCGFSSAAGENATHGKRRTNADKRAAVLRWLEDDEGRQWTDRYIGEQCHVSHPFVTKVLDQLITVISYQRPTKRR